MSKTGQILSFFFKAWDPGARLCYIIISGKNMWSISIFLIFPIKNEKKNHLWVSEKRTWALPLLHPPCPHLILDTFPMWLQKQNNVVLRFDRSTAVTWEIADALEALFSGKTRKLHLYVWTVNRIDDGHLITCHRETWKWLWSRYPRSLLSCWPFVNCLEFRSNSVWMGKEVLRWVRIWFCHLTD